MNALMYFLWLDGRRGLERCLREGGWMDGWGMTGWMEGWMHKYLSYIDRWIERKVVARDVHSFAGLSDGCQSNRPCICFSVTLA